ncbi:MAG: hypothetical protein ACRDT2_17880 [Natronosporangium sp.]
MGVTAPAEDYGALPRDDGLADAVEQVEAALVQLEDAALARVTRAALAEPGESIPWEQVKAEAGL